MFISNYKKFWTELIFYYKKTKINKMVIKIDELDLMVTERCNFRCKMCDIWREEYGNKDMSLDMIRKVVDSEVTVEGIAITGGEPFIREDLREVIDVIIREKSCNISIATNGFFTDRMKILLDEFRTKINSISISIDGIGKLHDKIRGIEGTFENALKSIDLIRLNYPNVRLKLKFTITKLNYKEILSTYKYFRERNLFLWISPAIHNKYYTNKISNDNFIFDDDQIHEITEQLDIIYKDLVDNELYFQARFVKRIPEYLRKMDAIDINCRVYETSLFIDVSGNVFSCKHLPSIGNMNELPLGEIVNSKKAKEMKNKILMGQCPKCWSPYGSYLSVK